MKFSLANKITKVLQENLEQKFTARQIAEWIFEKYPDDCEEKKKKSKVINSDDELVQQLVSEITSLRPTLQAKNSKIKVIEDYPFKYYFSELEDSDEVKKAEESIIDNNKSDKTSITTDVIKTEFDLYPILTHFLWVLSEGKIYSKRINDRVSSKSRGPNGNKWLHPDVVAMEALSQNWVTEIKDYACSHGGVGARLWSFEVKKLINASNVREVFFQAVSNSSWANFGYLVAGEIGGSGALEELRILSNLHGIGLIKLNENNPADSQIVIPAKERSDVDWDTLNRVAKENKDFLTYIKLVDQFYSYGLKEVNLSSWKDTEKIDKKIKAIEEE